MLFITGHNPAVTLHIIWLSKKDGSNWLKSWFLMYQKKKLSACIIYIYIYDIYYNLLLK